MLLQPSSFNTCPLCEAAVPRLLIENHVNSCSGKPSRTVGIDESKADDSHQPPKKLQRQPEPPMQQDCAEGPAVSKPAAKLASGNAFLALMAEQRERSKVVVLHLEHSADSTWQVHCWTKGPAVSNIASSTTCPEAPSETQAGRAFLCSQAAWSAQTQISSSVMQSCGTAVKASASTKLTFQLQTNVPSSAGGAAAQLTQLAPAATTFKGSASLLKSALQKNVRLCRAAPAVRWAHSVKSR